MTKGHGSKLHLAERGSTRTLCGLLFYRHVMWDHTGECARCAARARDRRGRLARPG